MLGLQGAGPVPPNLEVFTAAGMALRTLPQACTPHSDGSDAGPSALTPLVAAGHLVAACFRPQDTAPASALATSADDGRSWQPTVPTCRRLMGLPCQSAQVRCDRDRTLRTSSPPRIMRAEA